ncbi:hypothetical protein DFS33DRAFT_392825 [Desarmillaria ectypa]|nr:hypothetical protein DFS33DRAFT_392825 [Desarmillaria ectypa]
MKSSWLSVLSSVSRLALMDNNILLTTTVIQPVTGRIAVRAIIFLAIIEGQLLGRCWRQTARLSGTLGIYRWQYPLRNKSQPFADDCRASHQWYRWCWIAGSIWYNHFSSL